MRLIFKGGFTWSNMLANTIDMMFESMFEYVKGVKMLDHRVGWMSDLVWLLWEELAWLMSMYERWNTHQSPTAMHT